MMLLKKAVDKIKNITQPSTPSFNLTVQGYSV